MAASLAAVLVAWGRALLGPMSPTRLRVQRIAWLQGGGSARQSWTVFDTWVVKWDGAQRLRRSQNCLQVLLRCGVLYGTGAPAKCTAVGTAIWHAYLCTCCCCVLVAVLVAVQTYGVDKQYTDPDAIETIRCNTERVGNAVVQVG